MLRSGIENENFTCEKKTKDGFLLQTPPASAVVPAFSLEWLRREPAVAHFY